jgi:hypothetical protein
MPEVTPSVPGAFARRDGGCAGARPDSPVLHLTFANDMPMESLQALPRLMAEHWWTVDPDVVDIDPLNYM